MVAALLPAGPANNRSAREAARRTRLLRVLLPALSLAIVLGAIAWLNPRAISYFGFSLISAWGIGRMEKRTNRGYAAFGGTTR